MYLAVTKVPSHYTLPNGCDLCIRGYVFMALQHSLCVHNLNCSSQSMIDFVQVLGKTIKNTNMNDMKVEWKVEINFVLLKIYKNIRALKTLYVKQLSK